MNEMKRLIVCDGQCLEGVDIQKAQGAMETSFGLEKGEASALFSGQKVFVREVANDEITNKYKALFTRIGVYCRILEKDALGVVPETGSTGTFVPVAVIANPEPTQSVLQHIPNSRLCQKCNTPKTNDEYCEQCGIYFVKFTRRFEEIKSNKQEAPIDEDLLEEQQNKAKLANKFIFFGGLCYTVGFVSDELLANLYMLGRAGIDIGYIPYVLGTVFLSFGCALLAMLKGYRLSYGALALTGLVGLGVIMLLPDKRRAQRFDVFCSSSIIAYVFIGVGMCWLLNTACVMHTTNTYITSAAILAEDRHVYPSSTRDDLDRMIDSEIEELRQYLERGVYILDQYDLRLDDSSEVANTMYNEVAQLQTWLHYQRYLYTQQEQPLPESMQALYLHGIVQPLLEYLIDHAKAMDNIRFKEATQIWIYGGNNDMHWEITQFSQELNRMVVDWIIASTWRRQDKEKQMENSFLAEQKLSKIPHARIEKDGDFVLIRLSTSQKDLHGKTLVIAAYRRPIQNRSKKRNIIEIQQVGGTLRNRELQGRLNYLSGADKEKLLGLNATY